MKRECGFTSSRGFTLVEMLIALSIFGMLTAAGVALLSVTARTQETSDRLLEQLGEIRRTGALLGADLAHALPRIRRDSEGRPERAFAGGGGDSAVLLAFVRGGRDGREPNHVAYRLSGGALERLAWRRVDGGGEASAAVLLAGVTAVRLRYRDEDGNWRDRWDATDPADMPVAVELVTDSEAHGIVRQLFLVGSGGG